MNIKIGKSLQHLLESGPSTLQQLTAKIHQLKTINQQLQQFLDPALHCYCRAANMRDDCLVLEVDSSAWATRLRYQLPSLLTKLQTLPGLMHLNHIRYFIRQHSSFTSNLSYTAKYRPTLSYDTANLIKQTAENITDESLRAALLQLVKNASRND